MKLLFVGDVMIGRLVNEVLKKVTPEYPWGDTLSLFERADWRMCNLECVVSDTGTPWYTTPKVFHFRSDAKNIKVLRVAHINAVSLANNHVLDYEYDAMFEMFKALDDTGIAYAGAGDNIEEASRMAISRVGDMTIGIFSFTDNEPAWEAAKEKAGIYFVPVDASDKRVAELLRVIKKARQTVNILVVAAHWGSNWGYHPESGHTDLARALIDAGADIIFGHSCHVFRGIEVYKGKPIFYSTGNFIDDYAVDKIERNDESFVFIIETEGTNLKKVLLYPTIIRDFQAQIAKGERAQTIAEKMKKLCRELKTEVIWDDKLGFLQIAL